ncbi:MAG: hypothetical protein IPK21_07840 [Haliscomenobacter sp.]|nr:hypothetical protein [Haliscomenobacter sp.]
MPLYTHAIVREVPDAYAECLTLEAIEVPIDVPKAREQHEHFCAILAGLGLEVTRAGGRRIPARLLFYRGYCRSGRRPRHLTNPGRPAG